MKHYVGLDVTLKETSICIIDEARKVVKEGKVGSEWETIAAWLEQTGLAFERVEERVRELVEGDEILQQVAGAILSVRREVIQRLDDLHRMVLATVKADPVCQLLISVPGVGPVTAFAFRNAFARTAMPVSLPLALWCGAGL